MERIIIRLALLLLLAALIFGFLQMANSAPAPALIKVAVLDTGMDTTDPYMCPESRDFTGEGLADLDGHGTNITRLIEDNAGPGNYCILMLKIFYIDPFQPHYAEALEYLVAQHAQLVNMSIGGELFMPFEKTALLAVLNQGAQLFAAAGNDSLELTRKNCKIYPACLDSRIRVVGSTAASSNYGNRVNLILDGVDAVVGDSRRSGTSPATAIATGLALKKYMRTHTQSELRK